jgi:hypothetical protein
MRSAIFTFSMMRSTTRSTTVVAFAAAGCAESLLGRLDDVVVAEDRGQRLRQLRAVAIERVGLQGQAPGQHVGLLAVVDGRRVRHVDGLGDGARDEWLRGRHHADVAVDRQEALAGAAAGAGAVEHRQVLGLELRRALERHRAAAPGVRRLDVGLGEADRGQQVEGDVVELRLGEAEAAGAELLAQRPLVEGELHVEGALERVLELLQLRLAEALGAQRLMADGGRALERAVADRVADDRVDLALGVAERLERLGHHAVDDLEVAAAGQLLELHQREVGLDAGRVAIHDQADRAGRRDHGGLRVAVAVVLAERQRLVPGAARGIDQRAVGAVRRD